MNRRFASWALLLTLLLVVGLMAGRWLWTPSAPSPPTSFRVWWWERRELDLAVQIGLFLVGALGIAALLPPEREGAE
jgi:hypothetical protein